MLNSFDDIDALFSQEAEKGIENPQSAQSFQLVQKAVQKKLFFKFRPRHFNIYYAAGFLAAGTAAAIAVLLMQAQAPADPRVPLQEKVPAIQLPKAEKQKLPTPIILAQPAMQVPQKDKAVANAAAEDAASVVRPDTAAVHEPVPLLAPQSTPAEESQPAGLPAIARDTVRIKRVIKKKTVLMNK